MTLGKKLTEDFITIKMDLHRDSISVVGTKVKAEDPVVGLAKTKRVFHPVYPAVVGTRKVVGRKEDLGKPIVLLVVFFITLGRGDVCGI